MREIVCVVAEILKFSGGPIETVALNISTSHFLAQYTVTYVYYFVV